jgi:hypothetical protein
MGLGFAASWTERMRRCAIKASPRPALRSVVQPNDITIRTVRNFILSSKAKERWRLMARFVRSSRGMRSSSRRVPGIKSPPPVPFAFFAAARQPTRTKIPTSRELNHGSNPPSVAIRTLLERPLCQGPIDRRLAQPPLQKIAIRRRCVAAGSRSFDRSYTG